MGEVTASRQFKVFISYSRAESRFADELVKGLEYGGQFDVTIDRESIAEGEDWKLRLGALIAEADSIVFVISPDSAKSDICAWEVAHAKRLSKRIIPVLAKPVGKIPVPRELAKLNYVRFDAMDNGEPRSFMEGLAALVRALNTDIAWLHEHTRYLTLAQSWDEAGRLPNRLLSGPDIAVAKEWVAKRSKDAPEVTGLQHDFIKASEAEDSERVKKAQEQLEAISRAQEERERALARSEQQARKVRMVSYVAGAFALSMIAVGLYASERVKVLTADQATLQSAIADKELESSELEASISKLEATLGETQRLIRLVDSGNEKGQAGLHYTCGEAVDVTRELAAGSSPNQRKMDQFMQLYFGPMLLVEYMQSVKTVGQDKPRSIERAMVNFKNGFEYANSSGDRTKLCSLAYNVELECSSFLNSICNSESKCNMPVPLNQCGN
jgi:TIR domain